jgi:hypothetical protein
MREYARPVSNKIGAKEELLTESHDYDVICIS